MWPQPLEADVSPFEFLHVHQVLMLGLKSEVTLKEYFKQTVAMAIMSVTTAYLSKLPIRSLS